MRKIFPFLCFCLLSSALVAQGNLTSPQCNETGITDSHWPKTKTIPIRFHIVDDGNDRNFPDDGPNGSTRALFEEIVDWSNNQLANNESVIPWPNNEVPGYPDAGFRFVIEGYRFYDAAELPLVGYSQPNLGITFDDSPTAFNVHCVEKRRTWAAQPATIGLASVSQPTCGQANGSFQIKGLTPGAGYQYRFRKNTGALSAFSPLVNANANGIITISNLDEGHYWDIHVMDDQWQQITQDIDMYLHNTGAQVLKGSTLLPPSCGSQNGIIRLRTNVSFNQQATIQYTLEGQTQTVVATFVNGRTNLTGLAAGRYTHIQILGANGCNSVALTINLAEANALTPAIAEIYSESISSTTALEDGFIELSGLNINNDYKIWVKDSPTGTYQAYSSDIENGDFYVDGSEFRLSGLGHGYYSCYVTDMNDCQRSVSFDFRLGTDLRPNDVGGVAAPGSGFVTLYDLYHKYIYQALSMNVNNPGEPYRYSISLQGYYNYQSDNLLHELGHNASLVHVFPNQSQCPDILPSNGCNTNNYMESVSVSPGCIPNRAFSPCQIDIMHEEFENDADWVNRWYHCVYIPKGPAVISYLMDPATGFLTIFNTFPGASSGIQSLFTFTALNGSGEVFYSQEDVVQLSIEEFAGLSFEVCANTLDSDGCMGIEDCEIITFPTYSNCPLSQISYIDLVLDANGIPTSLDPSSSVTKPHSWTITSENGTTLSDVCIHSPNILYSPLAELIGDEIDVCVTVIGQSYGQPCTTEICTTFILPPTEGACGTLETAHFRHSIGRSSVPGSTTSQPYFVRLTTLTYPGSVLYTHTWYVTDNHTGIVSTYTGSEVELYQNTHFIRRQGVIDLEVCHVVKDWLNDCIVATNCQPVYYDCTILNSTGYGNISSVTFDAASQALIIVLDFINTASNISLSYYLNGQQITPTIVIDPSTNIYTATYPLPNNCGTAHVEVASSFIWANRNMCRHDEETLLYGKHPCKGTISPEGGTKNPEANIVGTGKGKRIGDDRSAGAMAVAPNPAYDGFTTLIFTTEAAQQVNIVVRDIQGKTLHRLTTSIEQGDNKLRLDLSHVSPGVYIVQADGLQRWTQKLMIK